MKTANFDSSITIDSPIGAITLKALGDKIVKIDLHGVAGGAGAGSGSATEAGANLGAGSATQASVTSLTAGQTNPALDRASQQLTEYFGGNRKHLDFAVETSGTDFQRAVWAEIAKVPFGEVITYSEIAKRISNPSAVRAVGGAVGSNPVPLVIGCHRILGSGDKITGYSGGDGLPTKRWLLAFEGISYRDVPEIRRDAETQIKIE